MVSIDVVSPHRDDAALSLSHTLRRVVAVGGDFRVVSCFTVSAWAPQLPGAKTVAEVSDSRRREDEAFVEKFGTAGMVCALEFADGPLRTDWSIQGRQYVQKAYGPDSDLVRELTQALRAHRREGRIWALPLATAHRDHVACLWAGIAAAPDAPLLLYEDMPYALRTTPGDLANQVARMSQHIGRVFSSIRLSVPFAISDWISDLSCYASQFSTEEFADIARGIAERGGECFWVDDRARQMLKPLLDF